MKKINTSITLDPEIHVQLKKMDINISDMANVLFANWLAHLKEHNLMDKTVENATAVYFMEQIKKKVYE